MAKPGTLIIDRRAFSWRRLVDLRRRQLEEWRAERCRQLTLFELKDDCRPEAERTAARRYRELTLFTDIQR